MYGKTGLQYLQCYVLHILETLKVDPSSRERRTVRGHVTSTRGHDSRLQHKEVGFHAHLSHLP